MDFVEDNKADGKVIGDASHIVRSVSRFFNNDEMSDIILKVGNKKYHAHRFVLVLMSDVFSALCSQRWNSSPSNRCEIELSECDQCIPVFPVFLQYLYHGSVRVDVNSALPLLMLADKYNVQPLKHCCEEYIHSQIEEGNVAGALKWLPYLQLCSNDKLEEACRQVVVFDMDAVLKCDDFYHLDVNFMTDLYSRDDLIVTSEHSLYLGMVKWMEAYEGDDHVRALSSLVRFSQMTADELMSVEKCCFFRKHRHAIGEFVANAHHFRSIACELQVLDEDFTGSTYRPRNYTDNRWCVSFNVTTSDGNNFHPKQITSPVAIDILNFPCFCPKLSSNDHNWEFQILGGEKYDYQFEVYQQWQFAGLGRVNSTAAADSSSNNATAATSPSTTATRSSGSSSAASSESGGEMKTSPDHLPLYISVRPLRPIRCNVRVDVSLFLVRNSKICKLLDTKTVCGPLVNSIAVNGDTYYDKLNCGDNRRIPTTTTTQQQQAGNRQGQTPRVFQPAPMHFSFIQPTPQAQLNSNQYPVVLKYALAKEWLMLPPEVPCVPFPIRFVPTTSRSLQGVVCVAVICKPYITTNHQQQQLS